MGRQRGIVRLVAAEGGTEELQGGDCLRLRLGDVTVVVARRTLTTVLLVST